MNAMEVLVKSLILLITEFGLKKKTVNSLSLVKELLEDSNLNTTRAKSFGDLQDVIFNLKNLLTGIINGDISPDDSVYASIEIILIQQPNLSKLISKYSVLKSESVIKVLKYELNGHLKRSRVRKLLQDTLGKSLNKTVDLDILLASVGEKIKKLKKPTNTKGTISVASLDTINFKDRKSVEAAAIKAVDLIKGNTVFKTGWSKFNTLTQNGLRRGETVTIGALPHNYKSSFLKSLFLQIPLFNKPIASTKEKTKDKQPLLLFITLEEEINNIMFFFFSYLKYSLEGIEYKRKDLETLNPLDVAKYVYEIIEKSGFTLIVERMRPDLFSKDEFENVVNIYEERGFDIQCIAIDYIKKMNRKGLTVGSIGSDLLELYAILRTITSSKDILMITPNQLNTRSKDLLQNGLPETEFVKVIGDKGPYAESKQLDQEIDLELFLKIIKTKAGAYLAIQRGKHRIPTVIPEEEKYMELDFLSKVAPIPHDSDRHSPCRDTDSSEDDAFMF